jgi:AcrR family transcriptional regulator
MADSRVRTGTHEPEARERIVDSSYELFSRRGIQAVGVDEVVENAGVAKATLYRHFPSKDDLVLAFLERREELWTHELVEAKAKSRGSTPEGQLLAIFDVFDEWFRREDFEACSFINVLLELGPQHPAGKASMRHLENIRSIVHELAEEAGLRDPASFARSWHILMKGSIVSAAEGDVEAAHRAQSIARLLIDQYR